MTFKSLKYCTPTKMCGVFMDCYGIGTDCIVGGDQASPLIHIRLREPKQTIEAEEAVLTRIIESAVR